MLHRVSFVSVLFLVTAMPGQANGSNSCADCHAAERSGFSAAHAFAADNCTACHGGNPEASIEAAAHDGLIAFPGDLATAERACGNCHAGRVAGVAGNLTIAQVDAENLPFEDATFDRVAIAFGLRNVTDKDAALRSMLRVLKPGGKVLILEFSRPGNALKPAYDLYSFKVLPLIGKVVARDEESYQYLAESIRMHPDQETLLGMMETAGFERCRYQNLAGGIVALHTGYRI